MKAVAPEVVRLMQSVLETRDGLRSLAVQIDHAGADPIRQAEALRTARAFALTHAGILATVLKQSAARRHCLTIDAPMWAPNNREADIRRR